LKKAFFWMRSALAPSSIIPIAFAKEAVAPLKKEWMFSRLGIIFFVYVCFCLFNRTKWDGGI